MNDFEAGVVRTIGIMVVLFLIYCLALAVLGSGPH
jgi:preprotein translocase subunit SecG